MDKLIELLNENTNGRFKTEQDLRLCIEMRGYCRDFIKWLVDNDKIEINKLREESFNIGLSLSSNFRKNKNGGIKNYYECKLLMLLAIQDEPIEFLCSILK